MAQIPAKTPERRAAVCVLAGAFAALAAAITCFIPASAFAGEAEITAVVGAALDYTLGSTEITFTIPDTPPTPDDPGTGTDTPDPGTGNEGGEDGAGEGGEEPTPDPGTEPEPEPEPVPIPDSYSFAITEGALPEGLAISMPTTDTTVSLRLTGTPATAGQFFFAVTWMNDTKGTVLDTIAVYIGVFTPPTVTITPQKKTVNLYDDETAGFDATVTGGTGDYGFRWFAVDAKGNATLVGSGMNYLFYPSASTLSLKDDGLTFYCEVTDRMTNLVGVSNRLTISVACVHSFGEWEENTPATCTEAQTLIRSCAKCGLREITTGKAATGHTWGEWRQVDSETMEHVCEICGAKESQAVVAGTPFIRVQPVGGSMYPDESLVLKVQAEATGLGWLTYEWQFSESANGPFEPLGNDEGSNNDSCVADRDGYYRVRVTQVAGADSNSVDSAVVRVHIHNMSVWSVDTSSNTATRACLTPDCPDWVSETLSLDDLIDLYPEDAELMGLSSARLFLAHHQALVLGGGVIVAAALLGGIVLLLLRRR